jgi:hypothetical protein
MTKLAVGHKRISRQAFVPRVVMSTDEMPFSIEMPKGSFWEKYAAITADDMRLDDAGPEPKND